MVVPGRISHGHAPRRSVPPFVNFVALAGHEVDDLVLADFIKLAGVRVLDAGHVAGEFDDCDLHAEADAEVGKTVLARVLRR